MTEMTTYPDTLGAEMILNAVTQAMPRGSHPSAAATPPAPRQRTPNIQRLMTNTPLRCVTMPAATLVNERIGVFQSLAELSHSPSRSLLVMNCHQQLIGIVTIRDVLCRVMDQRKHSLSKQSITTIMTPSPHVALEGDSLAFAIQRMDASAVGRLPVINSDGAIHGILTTDAVAAEVARMMESTPL